MKGSTFAIVAVALLLFSASPVCAKRSALRAGDTAIPVNFAVLPGSQQQGQPVKRAFIYTLARGHAITDSVMIVNPSKTASLTVRLSVSDADTLPIGGGVSFNDTSTQRQIGRWLRLGSSTVTVPPYHIVYVPMTLQLPASVAPGEYEGAINASDMQPQSVSSGKMNLRVFLNRRCMVLLRVLGHASSGLRVTNAVLAARAGNTLFRFVLHNTGTVVAYPASIIITFIRQGHTYTVRARSGMVMGGDSTSCSIMLDRVLPSGAYRANISLAYQAQLAPSTAMRQLHAAWEGWVVLS